MAIADFMKAYVQKNGWLSVGNIYFDNSLTVNPFTVAGRVCMSTSAGILFTTGKYDTILTEKLEHTYMSMNDKYLGYQQTICCCDLECLQHFDANSFCHERHMDLDPKKYPVPKIPTKAQIQALKPDPKTGLVPNTSTITQFDDTEMSVLDIYPEFNIEYFSSLKIIPAKEFYDNHDVFKAAVKQMFGVSDLV